MDNEEYIQTQNQIVLLGRLILSLDLPSFLDRISRAETIGPLINPTLYRDAMGNLQDLKDLAEALNGTRQRIQKILSQKGLHDYE